MLACMQHETHGADSASQSRNKANWTQNAKAPVLGPSPALIRDHATPSSNETFT